MPKQRYSLDETLSDAKRNIKEAAESQAPAATTENRVEETPAGANQAAGPDVRQAGIPAQEIPERGGKTADAPEGEGRGGKELPNPRIQSLVKRISNEDKRKLNCRNVFMDDDTLAKMEDMKKRMNRCRTNPNRENFIALSDLLGIAVREFLDKHYDNVMKDGKKD